VDGFDLNSPLVCEGIIGDGCGGGRVFFMKEDSLCVYDPMSKEEFVILEDMQDIQSISKSGCIITLVSASNELSFDLSTLA
jgi:hypothetical protein